MTQNTLTILSCISDLAQVHGAASSSGLGGWGSANLISTLAVDALSLSAAGVEKKLLESFRAFRAQHSQCLLL